MENIKDKEFPLSDIKLFTGISEDSIRQFVSEAPYAERKYNKGDVIATQGERCKSLYLLIKGMVCSQMENDEGRFITIDVIKAPNVLAPAFLYSTNNKFPVNIVAESDSTLLVFSKEYYQNFMHRDETAMTNFIRTISDRSVFLSDKLNEFALHSLKERLISYLQTNGKITNQQSTATKLGVTRPALARMISKLIDEGILKREENSSAVTLL